MSDLHNEYDRRGRRNDLCNPPPGHPQTGPDLTPLQGRIEALLLAGDSDVGIEAVRYGAAAAAYLDVPVVMIAGNHEYYNGVFSDVLADLRNEAERYPNVYFLENATAELELGGARLRVLGCSLWTDYALNGDDGETIARSMRAAKDGLSDHWLIRQPHHEGGHEEGDDGAHTEVHEEEAHEEEVHGGEGLFTPQQALALHRRSKRWLERALAAPFEGTSIIMTHHGVSARSVPDVFKGSMLSPCFASNLDDLVAQSRVPLWLHGHTHFDVDYQLGNTRVVARQRGYPDESDKFRQLIVDL